MILIPMLIPGGVHFDFCAVQIVIVNSEMLGLINLKINITVFGFIRPKYCASS